MRIPQNHNAKTSAASNVAQSFAYAAQREMIRSEDTSGMSERELSLLKRKIESIGVDIKDLMLELAQALRSFAVKHGDGGAVSLSTASFML